MTNPNRTLLAVALTLAGAALFASAPAEARTSARAPARAPRSASGEAKKVEWFQYLAPFNCGRDAGSGPVRVVPGFYATAVMLYNAGASDVTLRKNLALAFPPEEQATGEVSNQIEDVIAPGRALEVDCGEILNEFVFVNPLSADGSLAGLPRDREQQAAPRASRLHHLRPHRRRLDRRGADRRAEGDPAAVRRTGSGL